MISGIGTIALERGNENENYVRCICEMCTRR